MQCDMSREGSWHTKFFVLSDMQKRSPAQLIFKNDGDDKAEKSLK